MPVKRLEAFEQWHFKEFKTSAQLDRYILPETTFSFNKSVYFNTKLWRGSTTLDPAQVTVSMFSEMYRSSERRLAVVKKWLRC